MRYGQNQPKQAQTEAQKSSPSRALMGVSGTWSGSSVSWDVVATTNQSAATLTPVEVKALQKKHGSRNINTERIAEVKRLMCLGKTQAQIIQKLRGKRGMGERQVKKDMAALSKLKK